MSDPLYTTTIAWRRLDADPGIEMVTLRGVENGFTADGSSIAVDDEGPWIFRYHLDIDEEWGTRGVWLESTTPAATRQLTLEADGAGGWSIDGEEESELDGCIDVDFGGSIFTNTLVIRRLELAREASEELDVVWIGPSRLDREVMGQRYTHLEPDGGRERYGYRSLGSGTGYVLTVDDDGLVIDYEGIAERIFERRGAGPRSTA
jgi:hypothetical protein